MSAIWQTRYPDIPWIVDVSFMLGRGRGGNEAIAEKVGALAFINENDVADACARGEFNFGPFFGFAFDGVIPESLIHNFIGRHPESLVGGFVAYAKPDDCDWMADSRIKSIVNHMGSVLVELTTV